MNIILRSEYMLVLTLFVLFRDIIRQTQNLREIVIFSLWHLLFIGLYYGWVIIMTEDRNLHFFKSIDYPKLIKSIMLI
jgi:hypothetical protein